jgi:hypothetical protein
MIIKLLRNHFSIALIFLAIAFLVVIIGFYVWGIGYLATTVTQASVGKNAGASVLQFNLDAAAKLDYRGLAPTIPASGGTNGQ